MLAGTAFSFVTTLDPASVKRKDGRPVAKFKPATIQSELSGLVEMFKNWKVMTIFPIAMGESKEDYGRRMSSLRRCRSHIVTLLDSLFSLVQSTHKMHVECDILVYPNPYYIFPQVDLGIAISTPNPGFDRGE